MRCVSAGVGVRAIHCFFTVSVVAILGVNDTGR